MGRFLVVVESDLKELWRSGELVLMAVLLAFFQGLFFLIGTLVRREQELFARISGYNDSVLYQMAGVPVLLLSLVMVSAVGEYVIELGRRGALEHIQTLPVDMKLVMGAHATTIVSVSLLYYFAVTVPFVYLRGGPGAVAHLLPAMLVLALGLLPLFLFAALVALLTLLVRTEAFLELVSASVYTFTGIAYPLTVFPQFVALVAQLLPHPHVAESVRLAVFYGVLEPARLVPMLAVLAGYAVFSTAIYSRIERVLRRGGRYEVVTE
ncbi:MAG: ABC transporter permease [Nitrososphaerota archaeon]|nr:ABC transporter permease [Candidatus Calditenuis fumarioli]